MNWENKLDKKLRDLDDKIDRATGETVSCPPPPKPTTEHPDFLNTEHGTLTTASPPLPFAGLFASEPDTFFQATESELTQIYAYVIHAPHVTGNAHYARVASKTRLSLAQDNPSINAYATHGRNGNQPEISLLGGAIVFARLCGAFRALSESGGWQSLNQVWPVVGKTIIEQRGQLSPTVAREVLGAQNGDRLWNDEVVIRRAVAHSAGMWAGIMAHELGHLALGHTLGQASNLEVSRNQEREADSFASSVISTSVFSGPLVEGMILWELAWAWCQNTAGGADATTHPIPRERLQDFIRANENIAKGLGLTLDTLDTLLPA